MAHLQVVLQSLSQTALLSSPAGTLYRYRIPLRYAFEALDPLGSGLLGPEQALTTGPSDMSKW